MEEVYKWTTPSEAIKSEGRYWQSVSPEERLAAVETIRRATPGIYGEIPARLERTYRIIELAPGALPHRRSPRSRGRR